MKTRLYGERRSVILRKQKEATPGLDSAALKSRPQRWCATCVKDCVKR